MSLSLLGERIPKSLCTAWTVAPFSKTMYYMYCQSIEWQEYLCKEKQLEALRGIFVKGQWCQLANSAAPSIHPSPNIAWFGLLLNEQYGYGWTEIVRVHFHDDCLMFERSFCNSFFFPTCESSVILLEPAWLALSISEMTSSLCLLNKKALKL